MAPSKKTVSPTLKSKTGPSKAPVKTPVPKAKAIEKAPKKISAAPKRAVGKTKPGSEHEHEPRKQKAVESGKSAPKSPKAKKSVTSEPLPMEEPSNLATPAAGVLTAAPEPKRTDASRMAEKASAAQPIHVETALQAVKEGKAIELIFSDADANPPRTFEPRQLLYDTLSQAWYVWGWDRRYNAERHHRLDQMAEVNLVDGPGRSAQGPYKEGTPPNLIGGWLGGDPIHVKASLLKQWIFAVKQAPPAFPEFKIEDGEDGRAIVSFVATDLRAIARWCLQFGEGIQILEPQRLVDRVKQVGVAWGGKPAVAASAPAPKPAPLPPLRQEPRTEHRPEHRAEHKSEHKSEHRREHGKDREETSKKTPKVEIRIERL